MVGSDQVVVAPDGSHVRGRSYPWGVIEVDNEEHCDFVKLRQMLVRTYMEELREYTNDVLYENWRTEKLLSMGVAQDSSVFKEVKYGTLVFFLFVLHFLTFIVIARPCACRKNVCFTKPSSPRWRPR